MAGNRNVWWKGFEMNVQAVSMRVIPALLLGAAFLLVIAGPASGQASTFSAATTAAAARLGVDPQTIDDLVTANRVLAHERILDAYGHVSIRHPTRPNHYLIARSVAPEFITADDILEYDLDSNLVSAGEPKQFIERFIHGEIYKARPNVQAVIHSHSSALVPFSVSTIPLRPVFHMAGFIAGGVPVWDSAAANDPDAQGILVRNSALGASLAAAIGNRPVALMRGHGDVIAARGLKSAVRNAVFLDINARMQTTAIQLGGPIKYISPQEAKTMFGPEGDTDRAWDYWKRRAVGPK